MAQQKTTVKWEIPRRSRTCARGQEMLEAETAYYSLLIQEEEGRYERRDYCTVCWQLERGESPLPPEATHWRSMVPKRTQKKLDIRELGERALLLLREALDSQDPLKQQEAFALGLYLQRMKLGAVRQEVVQDGGSYALLEILETGEILSVPQLTLSRAEIDSLQDRVTTQLYASDSA